MIYYNDGRDVLETSYETCTSFAQYHTHPTLHGLQRRQRGIAMVVSLHSTVALKRFASVCYALEDSVAWDHFSFDVYDFAGIGELLPTLSPHGIVTGAGELFWIRHGRIVAAMIKDYNPTHFDELTRKITTD